jgi:hypothetical protein
MKYATIEDVISGFPHPVLPTVQEAPDYQTIHATWKFLQANSGEIDTHLGGGTLGLLGLITDAPYAMISPTTDAGQKLWISPQAPPGGPQPTGMAHRPRLALHATFGRRMSKLTAHTPPCNMIFKNKSSVFLTHVFGSFE